MTEPCGNGARPLFVPSPARLRGRTQRPRASMPSEPVPTSTASGFASNTAICRLRRSGCATSSASIRATSGCVARRVIQFELPTGPALPLRSKSLMRGSFAAHSRSLSREPSVEPSSRIRNSKSPCVCPIMLSMLASRWGSALRAGMTTLMQRPTAQDSPLACDAGQHISAHFSTPSKMADRLSTSLCRCAHAPAWR